MEYTGWDVNTRGQRMSNPTGRTIFKYEMPCKPHFVLELPAGANIIRVSDVDGKFWLWADVDLRNPTELRYFRQFKTGANIPDGLTINYLGYCCFFVEMEICLYVYEDLAPDAMVYKSDVIKHLATKTGKPVIDVKISEASQTDFKGIPTTEEFYGWTAGNEQAKIVNDNDTVPPREETKPEHETSLTDMFKDASTFFQSIDTSMIGKLQDSIKAVSEAKNPEEALRVEGLKILMDPNKPKIVDDIMGFFLGKK